MRDEDPRRHAPIRPSVHTRRTRKLVRGLRYGLTEEERYAVADDVVLQLKRYGDEWRLDEELPSGPGGHGTPPDWSKPSH